MLRWLSKLFSKKMNTAKINICIDPGHGLSNKRAGVYDSGAVASGQKLTEADIVLIWGLELDKQFKEAGFDTVLTREKKTDPCSLSSRVIKAKAYKSKLLISIHVNDADNKSATGTETFYAHSSSKPVAELVNSSLVQVLQLRNRGVKHESLTAHKKILVLSYKDSILIELGFIGNQTDYKTITSSENIKNGCTTIVNALKKYYDT